MTSCCCWWCCHPFEGDALNLPYKYNDRTKRFTTMGYFCSWGCMKAFNLDTHGINKGGIIAANISLMRKQMCKTLTSIKPAPSKYTLVMFGGTYSIDEFRKISESNRCPIVNMPDKPHNFIDVQILDNKCYKNMVQQELTDKQLDLKMDKISNAKTVAEPLKLKRARPLKRNGTNLENLIGITRN